MFLLQVTVVVLLAIGAVVVLVLRAQHESASDASNRSLAVAQGFAKSPGIVQAVESSHRTAVLQPRAEEAAKDSGVDFFGVMNRSGVYLALSSANRRPGTHTVTKMAPLLAGKTVKETRVGSLGPTVRVFVPVKKSDGSVVAVVGAGITVKRVGDKVVSQLPVVLGGAIGALALTTGGTAVVSRRLLRETHGLGPAEITRMYEHHDAVLHSVREGVLIVRGDGRLLLANEEARRLLDLPMDAERRLVGELGLDPGLAALLTSGRPATDEVHLAGDRLLAVNVRATASDGRAATSAVTLRDTTDLQALAGRAEAARKRLTLLYEAGVRIGTTLDVARTAEELCEMAVPQFSEIATVDLLEPVLYGSDPSDGGTEMRRIAVSGYRQNLPLYSTGELISLVPSSPMTANVASGHPVIEPDLRTAKGWRAQDPERTQRILDSGIHSLIAVPLRARGVVLGLAEFWRAESSETFEEEDLSFAEELAARAAVAIDNARRYTREHTMAVALQRSLLPRGVPEQDAVVAAHRYLPAQAGVGGDWFDVIPLPGARVALVVGDVVGHGLHAAATMGRLRTAVHNFSALDLSPDELLAHLDELAAHIDTDEGVDESEGLTGATCLYAIYDPVSGMCTVARAGHMGPALVHPDGTVLFPDIPVSPPLGLGGSLPFETAELRLPESSQLVLFTDGLIESRHRDLDTGLDLLRHALSHAERTPEQTCQAIIEALLPERPSDDVALLIARTQLLEPGQVAEWDVPSDPAAVSRVRNEATRRLEIWGLGQVTFTTELIISELLTNAVRYGTEPIRLRLLHDRRHLICEVSDGSSTSPHLRRAAITDEGGRGLFLVAQFARRWGTRYTPRGKIIWSEQAITEGPPSLDADLSDDILLDQWEE
ncbi:SpoIIE family protein phosphatase [Streptomyces sp. 5-6(2022)]|uniref:SpoIIE family protein phosphatase n=1 Tax=Streptomyces sp. 5-6(2022) TaxID=2936510 RepID=UPI0023BA2F5B|nr:SpoIIE family protein phosphatase [Streptomyces sp. 5-6(2022)]